MLNKKIKKGGIDHNLGTSKINQTVAKTDDSDDQVHVPVAAQMNHNTNSDNDDKDDRVGINKQSSTIGSQHDQIKATTIIAAAIVGYMMFR